MKRDYLDDPSYNYEAVNRASKACGPLVKWAIAQVRGGCGLVGPAEEAWSVYLFTHAMHIFCL